MYNIVIAHFTFVFTQFRYVSALFRFTMALFMYLWTQALNILFFFFLGGGVGI